MGVGILTRMGDGVEHAELEQRVPQLPKAEAGEPAGVRCTAGATARLRRQGKGKTARMRKEATSGEGRTALVWRQARGGQGRRRWRLQRERAGVAQGEGRSEQGEGRRRRRRLN